MRKVINKKAKAHFLPFSRVKAHSGHSQSNNHFRIQIRIIHSKYIHDEYQPWYLLML